MTIGPANTITINCGQHNGVNGPFLLCPGLTSEALPEAGWLFTDVEKPYVLTLRLRLALYSAST